MLSEEAFKGLDDFDRGSLNAASDSDYDDESEADVSDDDELAITKLGLPQRLVDSLENRGITQLFPIQVRIIICIFLTLFVILRNLIDVGAVCFFLLFSIKR